MKFFDVVQKILDVISLDAIAGLQPRSVHTTLNFSISVTVLPVDSNEEDKGEEPDFLFRSI